MGKVYHSLPKETQPAFYELVYMLCIAQTTSTGCTWPVSRCKPVVECADVPAGRYNQYAVQGRNAANKHAQAGDRVFFNDQNITESFHSFARQEMGPVSSSCLPRYCAVLTGNSMWDQAVCSDTTETSVTLLTSAAHQLGRLA